MSKGLNVLLLGRSGARINVLEDMLLGAPELQSSRRVLGGEVGAPLAGLNVLPDVIVMDIGAGDRTLLASVYDGLVATERPPLVVIGPEGDVGAMRLAMQAGARDFHTDAVSDEELTETIRRVGLEARLTQRRVGGSLTAVINGKGGSGSSFVTSSLATVPSVSKLHAGTTSVALDFDLQFGDLPVYFDLPSDDGLLQALARIGELDVVGLDGLIRSHSSGARLLAGRREQFESGGDFDARAVSALLGLLGRSHDHVIVDVPRQLNDMTVAALEQADRVIVVAQQTVPHVRDARFMVGLLRDIGVPDSSITILMNRFDRKNAVRLEDVRDVFENFDIRSVPNDYKLVASAVDNGVPVLLSDPKSRLAKAVVEIADELWPRREQDEVEKRARRGLFRRRNRH